MHKGNMCAVSICGAADWVIASRHPEPSEIMARYAMLLMLLPTIAVAQKPRARELGIAAAMVERPEGSMPSPMSLASKSDTRR